MIRERDKKQPALPGFESPFERSLSPNNRWIKLAEVVPWDEFATAYYSGMCADQGAPAKPARLMVGAVIIKHRQRWTDEEWNWGYNRMTTVQGLFTAGDGVGAS
ncbi:MAG: hypothetical protein H7835_16905, partial [Magnetococcus sp. XQGC-1]